MSIHSILPATTATPLQRAVVGSPLTSATNQATALAGSSTTMDEAEVRRKFQTVLGELLFTEMLKGARKTVGKPAYFYGGQAEEIFTQQLDQILAEKMSHASSEQWTASMYDLFTLPRR